MPWLVLSNTITTENCEVFSQGWILREEWESDLGTVFIPGNVIVCS